MFGLQLSDTSPPAPCSMRTRVGTKVAYCLAKPCNTVDRDVDIRRQNRRFLLVSPTLYARTSMPDETRGSSLQLQADCVLESRQAGRIGGQVYELCGYLTRFVDKYGVLDLGAGINLVISRGRKIGAADE